MSHPPEADRLSLYLEGALSDAEATALEGELKSDPRLARELLTRVRDEVVIARWAQTANAVGPELAARRMKPRRLPLFAVSGLAAAAVIAVILSWTPTPHTPPAANETTAQVERTQGEAFLVVPEGRTRVAVGDLLRPGQEVRTDDDDSYLVLRYSDGARVEVGPGSTVRLLSDGGRRIYQEEGTLTAAADGPMTVLTPHAEVEGRNSRFRSDSTAAATRVESEQGLVRVTRTSDRSSVEVAPQSYAVALGSKLSAPQGVGKAVRMFKPELAPRRAAQPRLSLPLEAAPIAVAFSPRGGLLAALTVEGKIKVWDALTGAVRCTLEKSGLQLTAMAFSPDGRTLAAGGRDKQRKSSSVVFWDVASGLEKVVLPGPQIILALVYAADGRTLAVGGQQLAKRGFPEGRLWLLGEEKAPVVLEKRGEAIQTLAFAADGRLLAAGSKDGVVRLWDAETHEEREHLEGHVGPVLSLCFAPDGRTLASGGKDGTTRLWDLTEHEIRLVLPNPRGAVGSVAFGPRGDTLLAAGLPGFATLWDAVQGEPLQEFAGYKNAMRGIAVSFDGALLATAGSDRTIKVWDLVLAAQRL